MLLRVELKVFPGVLAYEYLYKSPGTSFALRPDQDFQDRFLARGNTCIPFAEGRWSPSTGYRANIRMAFKGINSSTICCKLPRRLVGSPLIREGRGIPRYATPRLHLKKTGNLGKNIHGAYLWRCISIDQNLIFV